MADENEDRIPVQKQIAAIQGLIDAHGRYRSVNGKPRGFDHVHPSASGACLRLMQYQRFAQNNVGGLTLPIKQNQGSKQRVFDTGHAVHDRWAAYWQDIGVLRGVWQCTNKACRIVSQDGSIDVSKYSSVINSNKEQDKPRFYGKEILQGCFRPQKCTCGCTSFKYNQVDILSKQLNMHGHADLVLDFRNFDASMFQKGNPIARKFDPNHLPKGLVVADMKSINNMGFENLKKNGPSLKYQIQLKVYINILDVDYGVLIYENKDTSQVAAFHIDRGAESDWPLLQKQFKSMISLYDQKKLPPPKALRKDSYECKYCDFKQVCNASKIWDAENLPQIRKAFYGHLM